MADKLFRMILQVDDLDKAADFYAKLLDDPGRRIPRASRHYIDCGPVILALVDVTAGGDKPAPLPDYIYFAVGDLEKVYARAIELGWHQRYSLSDLSSIQSWSGTKRMRIVAKSGWPVRGQTHVNSGHSMLIS